MDLIDAKTEPLIGVGRSWTSFIGFCFWFSFVLYIFLLTNVLSDRRRSSCQTLSDGNVKGRKRGGDSYVLSAIYTCW